VGEGAKKVWGRVSGQVKQEVWRKRLAEGVLLVSKKADVEEIKSNRGAPRAERVQKKSFEGMFGRETKGEGSPTASVTALRWRAIWGFREVVGKHPCKASCLSEAELDPGVVVVECGLVWLEGTARDQKSQPPVQTKGGFSSENSLLINSTGVVGRGAFIWPPRSTGGLKPTETPPHF